MKPFVAISLLLLLARVDSALAVDPVPTPLATPAPEASAIPLRNDTPLPDVAPVDLLEQPSAGDLTPDEASGNRTQREKSIDEELTRTIRRAIVGDRTLSFAAHNVRIFVRSGIVTLQGTVRSASERRVVEAIANNIVGYENVHDELDVSP